jgi:epsilon-lactone hydrolase
MTPSPTRPGPPVPTSVSDLAQRYLATPSPFGSGETPALGDTEAWLRYIEERDTYVAARFAGLELPVDIDEKAIAGVRTFVVRAHDVIEERGPIYLDIHGGALILGGGDVCRLMATAGAMGTGMVNWAPDYRMPPLHPYPAALDDCLSVYARLLEERMPDDIVVGGGSAGGNLAAALLVRARDEGLPMPAALVLVSPEVDLTESGDSFHTNRAIDHVLNPLLDVNVMYADGHDLAHPYLSPLFADLTGFPPTFLQTGTRDLFLSNTVRMHRKLRAAGVEADLHVGEAMPHGGFGGGTPEDLDLHEEMRRFLDRHRRNR